MKKLLLIPILLTACAKPPVSVCGPSPVVEIRSDVEGAQLDSAKFQSLVSGDAAFPMSAEKSGNFKDAQATAILHVPTLLCILGEHSKAYPKEDKQQ